MIKTKKVAKPAKKRPKTGKSGKNVDVFHSQTMRRPPKMLSCTRISVDQPAKQASSAVVRILQ